MQNSQDELKSPVDQEQKLQEKTLLYKYHQVFYKIFKLPLDWMPPDNQTFTICGKAHCNALCTRIMESDIGAKCCQELEKKRVETASATGQPVIDCCHAGFCDVTIPIIIDGLYHGSLCCGQYLSKLPSGNALRKLEKKLAFLELKKGELGKYYQKSRILTKDEEEGMIELMKLIAASIKNEYGRWLFLENIRQSDPITQATQYIQRHFARALTVEGLARSVGMSKSYFIHRFSQQTGYSPIEYLNRYRISQCEAMLRKSTMNVSQIAYICGFSNITFFNRLFRRYVGTTPSLVRKGKGTQPKS